MGVVPVATTVGGNPEVVEDGHSGLFVQPKDAEQISDYLIQLATAETWRLRRARQERARTGGHSV